MINFFKITNNGYQVMLEGSAFYFLKKLPVAFREKGERRIYIKTPKNGHFNESKVFADSLKNMGTAVDVIPSEFEELIRKAYNAAILRGSTRSALEKFGVKEKKDVDHKQSNADEIKNRIYRDGLLGSCRNAFRK